MSESGAKSADTPPDELTEKLLDFLVYAPIGLVLDAQTVAPDLARRGRQHTAAARQIGEMAVKAGLKRLEGARTTEDATNNQPAAEASSSKEKSLAQHADRAEPAAPTGDHLAIEEYDLLAASQVVKRLDSLTPDELSEVAAYETATRGRRTILNKATKLQTAHDAARTK